MSKRDKQAPERRVAGSWVPGQKGQGAEGQSKGYGGAAGSGKGAAGPETKPKMTGEAASDKAADAAHRDRDYSPSLPTREQIRRVLR